MSVSTKFRSFIDLRAAAAAAEVPAGDYLSARASIPLPAGPVTVDILRLDAAGGSVTALAGDEFVIVLDGTLALDATVLTAGTSAVAPAGASFDWRAGPGTLAIVMRHSGGAADAQAIVPIDEDAALEPSGAPLAELLVGETPSCRNHTDYRSPNGEFVCGTWDSTPYHRLPMTYRHYELMHLLDGSVTFEDEAGRTGTFGRGDVFLVEQGARCSWLSTVHVKKVYAIYRPAA